MSFAMANDRVWKQIADEKQATACTMARVAFGAIIVAAVLAGTAFSAHSNYSSMCSYVGERNQADTTSNHESELTRQLLKDYCS